MVPETTWVLIALTLLFIAGDASSDTQDRFEATHALNIKSQAEQREISRLNDLGNSLLYRECVYGEEGACEMFNEEVVRAHEQCRKNILPYQSYEENEVLCDKYTPVIHDWSGREEE